MYVHILMFDDVVERVSCDGPKIYQMADEYNGDPNVYGPYLAITMELEDVEKCLEV